MGGLGFSSSEGVVLLVGRARFLSYVSRGISGTFWGLERRFAWQVQDIGHFFIRVAGVALSGRC